MALDSQVFVVPKCATEGCENMAKLGIGTQMYCLSCAMLWNKQNNLKKQHEINQIIIRGQLGE